MTTSGGRWSRRSVAAQNWSTNLSSTMVTGLVSTFSTAWQPAQCQTVQLSTGEGAKCDCGKLAIDAKSLQVKQITLGEVRQIVASGYKLAHGEPLVTIQWK